jgi:prenylcysteine oxidase/farnesylcysteine lyase
MPVLKRPMKNLSGVSHPLVVNHPIDYFVIFMLWSLLVFPALSFAFNWLPFLGGTTASDQYVIETPELEPRPDLRVAIIGAGAAGSSAAFWLHEASSRLGKNISVDVFERSGYIGGRELLFGPPHTFLGYKSNAFTGSTTVYPYDNTSFPPVELGGSIFVDANKNLVRAAQEFGLEVRTLLEDGEQLGVWDGSQFLIIVRTT